MVLLDCRSLTLTVLTVAMEKTVVSPRRKSVKFSNGGRERGEEGLGHNSSAPLKLRNEGCDPDSATSIHPPGGGFILYTASVFLVLSRTYKTKIPIAVATGINVLWAGEES